MSPPSFLDKLAPELRVAIFGHVLGSSNAIKPSNSTASLGINNSILALSAHEEPKQTTVEAFILATNKLIFKEATQVLYHNRTFRATFAELEILLQHKNFVANVEFIEVADCIDIQGTASGSDYSSLLKSLQQLPRIRSVVILSDCLSGLVPHDLAYNGGPPHIAQLITVPSFVKLVAGLGNATCVDIGRYQLHGEYSGVQVVNRRLTAMWPNAQDIPADYDAWDHFRTLVRKWGVFANDPERVALTLQTSFKCWVGLHEGLASMETSGKLTELLQQDPNRLHTASELAKLCVARHWAAITLRSRLSQIPYNTYPTRVSEPRTLNLRHLKPGDDPDMLGWATEYLATNVALFRCDSRTNASFNHIAAQHWVEVDGGTHNIEWRLGHQKLAFAGLPNPSYVLEPVRKTKLLHHAAVQYQIKGSHLDRLATRRPTEVLDPLEFVQLARLCIAMYPDHAFLGLPTDANYPREREEWAADYLKRHLLVSDWVDPDVVQEMSLADMRNSLTMLLERPPQSLNEIRTDPPEGLDTDLFLPLAWKWSWEYASICVEQQRMTRSPNRAVIGRKVAPKWLQKVKEKTEHAEPLGLMQEQIQREGISYSE